METATEITNFPEYVRKSGGSIDEKGYLNLPESLGNGYLKIRKPLPQLTIMFQHYELNKSHIIKRDKDISNNNTLLFSFRNLLKGNVNSASKNDFKYFPSVQISTSDVVMDIKIPSCLCISNIIIEVEMDFLQQLLKKDGNTRLTELFTKKNQSYLYEEIISPKIQSVATEMFEIVDTDCLTNFYYIIKAEELIYLFLESLLQRNEMKEYPVHQKDIEAVFLLREDLLKDMSNPPKLEVLAAKYHMSVSKLGKIFRQIFGESIYNYYQKIKMQEAAFLIREEKLSISQTGYQLGFSNLSHFSRLFEKHIGMKPKSYSKLI